MKLIVISNWTVNIVNTVNNEHVITVNKKLEINILDQDWADHAVAHVLGRGYESVVACVLFVLF